MEGDGYDVVAEASTPADLARILAEHRPDVVVLDESIGATAPQVVREISPRSKIVLVWPGAVVPIGGDARVEPSQVLRQLGPTVAKVAAGIAGLTSIARPEWVEKVRKDPATLREMLERSGGLPTKRPSVTELQRRGQRLHPTSPEPEPSRQDDDHVASVVPIEAAAAAAVTAAEATIELPETPESGTPVLHLPDERDDRAAGVVAAGPTIDAGATELNRRLGMIALGGAAVIGAVVFALALGGSRLPTDIIVAEGPRATIAPGAPIDSGLFDPGQEPGQEPGEPGTDPGEPGTDPGEPGGEQAPETPGGGTEPPPEPPGGGTEPPPEPPGGGTEPPPEPPGGGTEPPPEPPGGGTEPPPPLPEAPSVNAPGKSGAHNPHGAPPGQASETSNGGSGPAGNGARHWEDGLPGHAGEHGQGIEHGKGLEKLQNRDQA